MVVAGQQRAEDEQVVGHGAMRYHIRHCEP
jgi:hypothetical protein